VEGWITNERGLEGKSPCGPAPTPVSRNFVQGANHQSAFPEFSGPTQLRQTPPVSGLNERMVERRRGPSPEGGIDCSIESSGAPRHRWEGVHVTKTIEITGTRADTRSKGEFRNADAAATTTYSGGMLPQKV